MRRFGKFANKILNSAIVLVFAFMVILVFLNASLRYLFSSGLTWSEELSRYAFVWVVFLGAISAFVEGSHIIVDLLIRKLPPSLKKVMFVIVNLIIITIMWLFFDGLIGLTEINKGISAPSSGLPKNTMYLAGVISSLSIILISVYQIISVLVFNRNKPEWMVDTPSKKEGDYK